MRLLQPFRHSGNEGRFAGADRAHEINGFDSVAIEDRSVFLGYFCVRLEEAMLQFDVIDFFPGMLRIYRYHSFVVRVWFWIIF